MTDMPLTPTCQNDPYTTTVLVAALETAWTAIRVQHPDVPHAVIVVGSGASARRSTAVKYGHFASLRWQVGTDRLPEVLISGEGLQRPPEAVLTTLLHEATHGLADRRGIQDSSRQGRWHNRHFAILADELGLVATKDDRIGWSPCTLRPDTATRYTGVLDQLGVAMRAWRHTDEHVGSNRSNNNGQTLTCECPRKIRVATSVSELGPILCGVCDTAFSADI